MNEFLDEMLSEWSPELTVMDWAVIKQALVAKAAEGNLQAIALIFRMAKVPAYQAACAAAQHWRQETAANATPSSAIEPAPPIAEPESPAEAEILSPDVAARPAHRIPDSAPTPGHRKAARHANRNATNMSESSMVAPAAEVAGCASGP